MAGPLYREIADDLRRKIKAGDPPPGVQLPTEIELMEQYNASRNTVRDAIKLLTSRGLVESRPGQGTFVVEEITPFVTTLTADPKTGRGGGEVAVYGGGEEALYTAAVTAEGRRPVTSEPRVEIQRADRAIAQALGVAEGEQVISRHQERLIDDTPFSLQTSFYPMHLVERGAAGLIKATDIEGGAVAYLAKEIGLVQAGYRDTIEVRQPDETEITFFRLPADGRTPVFEVHRVAFGGTGERIRLTVTVYPVDRNRLVINVGMVPESPDQATADGRRNRAAVAPGAGG